MRKNKKAGFTLIELIAVLVILSIIALIVIPLVMNIVKKAKDSANKRSVDAYGKSLELSVANYLLEYKDYPSSLLGLNVEYSGNEVVCNIKKISEDGSVYLSGCSVNGVEVKDSSTEDGYYHYGKTTDTSSPEYVVYQAYSIGDIITYNGINFYVIEASDETNASVTLLKETPLTVEEVNNYGVGHVNGYTMSSVGTAYDLNGYGGMAYYTSETCGYVKGSYVNEGCKVDYSSSDVKYVIDAWVLDKLNPADLKNDDMGYSARLITKEELISNLPYNYYRKGWVYNSNYSYWTMNSYESSTFQVRFVFKQGILYDDVYNYYKVIRPVVTVKKSAI